MQGILDLPGTMAQSLQELATTMAFGRDPMPPPQLAPTPKDTVLRDGIAQLYRFRRPEGAPTATRRPLLVVPSMINRWYVLDLRRGNSFCEALAAAGVDAYLLDWGVPQDEDRYFTWDEAQDRLHRMVRAARALSATEAFRDRMFQFDVVAVSVLADGAVEVVHWPHAFDSPE